MKSLTEYIAALNNTYTFRVKVANKNPTKFMEQIKNALDTYELISVSKPKSLPVMEHQEFPQQGACECWQFDVEVAYPTTTVQIGQLLRERANMTPDWVCVQTKDQAEQFATAEAYGKDHKGALLSDATLKDAPGAQELVGQKRITSMLKELQKHSVPVAEKTAAGKTTNDVPQGTTSPMGS
jgi:hypothetical protein